MHGAEANIQVHDKPKDGCGADKMPRAPCWIESVPRVSELLPAFTIRDLTNSLIVHSRSIELGRVLEKTGVSKCRWCSMTWRFSYRHSERQRRSVRETVLVSFVKVESEVKNNLQNKSTERATETSLLTWEST